MLTQVSLMPLITMPHVHGGQRGAECSSGQRGWSGLIGPGSGLSLICRFHQELLALRPSWSKVWSWAGGSHQTWSSLHEGHIQSWVWSDRHSQLGIGFTFGEQTTGSLWHEGQFCIITVVIIVVIVAGVHHRCHRHYPWHEGQFRAKG